MSSLNNHLFRFIFLSLCAMSHLLPLHFATWPSYLDAYSCLLCIGVDVGDTILLLLPALLGAIHLGACKTRDTNEAGVSGSLTACQTVLGVRAGCATR
jgi:hypothetical protein